MPQSNKIKLTVGEKVIVAAVNGSKASQDFITLVPLTLTLEDYNATEKISDLPKKLSTEGSPTGYIPSLGHIAYYAPWGNIAIFYKDFRYSSGLIKLGRIDSGIEEMKTPGSLQVKIELVD